MESKKILKKGERIDQLYSQDVQIIQNPQCFAFSLDAVLLADFVRPNHRHKLKVVDLCAGNGAIGIFLHNKLGGNFKEVELQPQIADMAERTILLNGFQDRYTVINTDIANINDYIPKDSVDIVLCNPPYFPVTPQSQKNPNKALAIARHEIATDLATVVKQMSGLLKMNGHGYLVHRPDRLAEILTICQKYRLAPKRLRFIYPKPDRDANILLLEVIKDGKPGGIKVVPPLIVHGEDGKYLPAVQELLYGK
ncbi:tRNA1(Val) (adenine(37)-N6)-methyltransferase [Lactobacillus sp. 0.1XD8-4]|uniref:tRNA1(Val) (Adenine(37)-N6)-methyltransferase n=1 Tax=Limosilactobacillus walteri TaxID=2268022 RepID=A0ABR8P9B4_9LACO|nr:MULTISPECIES: tRNA1(Val) (adenine(37)-N6)-methyltransferase [Lactobacillaceae]MBD5807308.1 tRNA1(Val) (adenine(37)-N6)-methyltransferase [Limosilactobacillus walteri]MRN06726.1 tRNA1(Val) (adenine(37)-N6)-methyltransferase [Lactobacillus sp. 0.1XD8-4]